MLIILEDSIPELLLHIPPTIEDRVNSPGCDGVAWVVAILGSKHADDGLGLAVGLSSLWVFEHGYLALLEFVPDFTLYLFKAIRSHLKSMVYEVYLGMVEQDADRLCSAEAIKVVQNNLWLVR